MEPKIVFDFPVDVKCYVGRYYVSIDANEDTANLLHAMADLIGKDPTAPHIMATFGDSGITVTTYEDSSQDRNDDA